jgi:hypothetical protein
MRVGVQGQPVDAGTAGAAQGRAFPLVAKARADTPHPLPGPRAKGHALLDRGRQCAGQLGVVVARRVVARGHHVLGARFEGAQRAEGTDNALTDRLKDGGDVRVRGRVGGQKTRLEARGGAIDKDPFEEDHVGGEIGIE